ncbi:MAG: hypothetical protein ABH986_02280 [archaeon]
MRYFILFTLLLFLFPLVLADIGPSPDYSFSIGNAGEYPAYKFYYAGNIWPEKLTLVESNQFVYKLNTNIKVYAVPLELASDSIILESEFEQVSSQSIVSQGINLSSGETVFEVKSFDETQKTMVLEAISNNPDDIRFDFFSLIPPLIFVGIIIVVLFFVVKFLKKQGKK